jgi:hypothetical protein
MSISSLDKPLTELSREDIVEFSRKRGEPEWILRIDLKLTIIYVQQAMILP